MKRENIRPCPFCGSKKVKICLINKIYWICCISCNSTSGYYNTRAGAKKNWNKRFTSTPSTLATVVIDEEKERKEYYAKKTSKCKEAHHG